MHGDHPVSPTLDFEIDGETSRSFTSDQLQKRHTPVTHLCQTPFLVRFEAKASTLAESCRMACHCFHPPPVEISMPPLSAILETVLYCRDLDAAKHFYSHVLGLVEYSHQPSEYLFYRVGQGMLLLFNPDRSREKNRMGKSDQPPGHGCSGSGHMAFAIEPDQVGNWRSRLEQHQVPIESEFTWPTGGQSIYFRDPADNSIELATRNIWP